MRYRLEVPTTVYGWDLYEVEACSLEEATQKLIDNPMEYDIIDCDTFDGRSEYENAFPYDEELPDGATEADREYMERRRREVGR